MDVRDGIASDLTMLESRAQRVPATEEYISPHVSSSRKGRRDWL